MSAVEDIHSNRIETALKKYQMYGENIPVYYDKQEQFINKDRVAASFISDEALGREVEFDKTILTAINIDSNKKVALESNITLSYEAIISLIYRLRLSGYAVHSITNIATGDTKQLVSIDDLHTDTDIVKVSVSDNLRGLVRNIMKSHIHRDFERHTCKLITFSERIENKEAILVALNKSYTHLASFSVTSDNGDRYYIFDGSNMTCIIDEHQMLFVSTNRKIDTKSFIANLDNQQQIDNIGKDIQITKEIFMF